MILSIANDDNITFSFISRDNIYVYQLLDANQCLTIVKILSIRFKVEPHSCYDVEHVVGLKDPNIND